MKKEYKKFVVNAIYPDGFYSSTSGLEHHINREFKRLFNRQPEKVIAKVTRWEVNGETPGSFIGAVEVSFTIDGEIFVIERDHKEEYVIDIKHPDYETDDYFYEDDKSYCVIKRKNLLQLIDDDKL